MIYVIAGLIALARIVEATVVSVCIVGIMILIAGIALVVPGIMRIILAFSVKEGTPWIWVVVSG